MTPTEYARYRREEQLRYLERLRDRLARADLDVAWEHRQTAVLHALMLQEQRKRLWGDSLLLAQAGAIQ